MKKGCQILRFSSIYACIGVSTHFAKSRPTAFNLVSIRHSDHIILAYVNVCSFTATKYNIINVSLATLVFQNERKDQSRTVKACVYFAHYHVNYSCKINHGNFFISQSGHSYPCASITSLP